MALTPSQLKLNGPVVSVGTVRLNTPHREDVFEL